MPGRLGRQPAPERRRKETLIRRGRTPLRVVVECGNGGAGVFAWEALQRPEVARAYLQRLASEGVEQTIFDHCVSDLLRLPGLRPLAVTALLLGVLQALFLRGGSVLLELGPVTVTQTGLEMGVYVAGRFLAVVLLSYLYVLTTEPNDLAYALMQVGLPYRYGFALITALRLVPLFEQEGQTVYNAQLARGVRYDVRSPRRLLILARQFFLPLLVSALGKVDALAVSMEGRCFGKYPTRTFLRQVRWARRDWASRSRVSSSSTSLLSVPTSSSTSLL